MALVSGYLALFLMNLIHNAIYRDVTALAFTIIGVLTFLLVAFDLFKVVGLILSTDLSIWITLKFVLIEIPFVLTITIPSGLLAAVLIVFGRMSSDRELLAMKSCGVSLMSVVPPVIILAFGFCLLDYWLNAFVVPACREANSNMRHEIVTNNPMDLFSPNEVIDKLPGYRIFMSRKDGTTLYDVQMWQFDSDNNIIAARRADYAKVKLDQEHGQMVMTLFNAREEDYPPDGDPTLMRSGARAGQLPVYISLASFSDKAERRLSWMTLPEIEKVIEAMQQKPANEPALPYLTEFQARWASSLACITFVIIGVPLAIQTQRRETSAGVIMTIVVVGLYLLLGSVGRALKTQARLYPELIIWTPNLIFQAIGALLFHRANRK